MDHIDQLIHQESNQQNDKRINKYILDCYIICCSPVEHQIMHMVFQSIFFKLIIYCELYTYIYFI